MSRRPAHPVTKADRRKSLPSERARTVKERELRSRIMSGHVPAMPIGSKLALIAFAIERLSKPEGGEASNVYDLDLTTLGYVASAHLIDLHPGARIAKVMSPELSAAKVTPKSLVRWLTALRREYARLLADRVKTYLRSEEAAQFANNPEGVRDAIMANGANMVLRAIQVANESGDRADLYAATNALRSLNDLLDSLSQHTKRNADTELVLARIKKLLGDEDQGTVDRKQIGELLELLAGKDGGAAKKRVDAAAKAVTP